MKYITPPRLIALVVLSFTLALGCKPSEERTSDSSTETIRQQTARAEAAVADATEDLEAYTYAQKSQFVASMEADLKAINRSIEELADRIERSGEDAKDAATPRLNELRHQADRLQNHIDEVENATASTWDTAKANTREMYDNLKHNFDDARQWLSDKIEP